MNQVNQARELSTDEIDSVVGGDNSVPLGGALGPYVDGIVLATADGAAGTVDAATSNVNGIITAADPGPAGN